MNGSIVYSNEANNDGSYPFSTSANYVCDSGFGLVDGPTAKECSGDGSSSIGEFVGESTTCVGKYYKD